MRRHPERSPQAKRVEWDLPLRAAQRVSQTRTTTENSTENRRPAKSRPSSDLENELLLRRDRVLRSLGHAEFHHGLGLDLDRFAGLGIAPHARLAVRLHQAAEAGYHEDAVFLRLFDCGVSQVLHERRSGLVGELSLFSQQPNQLSFRQT